MIQFSDFIENLSDDEMEQSKIVLDGYQMEIAHAIDDDNERGRYGIINIEYIEEKDCAIIYFDPTIFQDMIEEYNYNDNDY